MNDDLRKSFEMLLKNGDYVKAETELIKFMKLEPEDRDAKMLYGTCRMLQGDTETAKRIHDELEPFYSNSDDIPKSEKSFWQKYHRWIIYGSVGALVAIGGIAVFGPEIMSATSKLSKSSKTYDEHKNDLKEARKERKENDGYKYGGKPRSYYCKVCGNSMEIAFGWDDDKEAELSAKMNKGLIPCKTCGKDTPYSETQPDITPKTSLPEAKK